MSFAFIVNSFDIEVEVKLFVTDLSATPTWLSLGHTIQIQRGYNNYQRFCIFECHGIFHEPIASPS